MVKISDINIHDWVNINDFSVLMKKLQELPAVVEVISDKSFVFIVRSMYSSCVDCLKDIQKFEETSENLFYYAEDCIVNPHLRKSCIKFKRGLQQIVYTNNRRVSFIQEKCDESVKTLQNIINYYKRIKDSQ